MNPENIHIVTYTPEDEDSGSSEFDIKSFTDQNAAVMALSEIFYYRHYSPMSRKSDVVVFYHGTRLSLSGTHDFDLEPPYLGEYHFVEQAKAEYLNKVEVFEKARAKQQEASAKASAERVLQYERETYERLKKKFEK